jgi:hexosaminidase
VVAFAKVRHVDIIPEIDIPGHAVALIAAYPELGCPHLTPMNTEHRWGVFHGVLCAGKEEVLTFLENLFRELASLFPSPWIHIGGDESPRENWEKCDLCQAKMREEGFTNSGRLQSYMIRRISQ